MDISDLKKLKIAELTDLAQNMKIEGYSGLRKQELIFKILEEQTQQDGHIFSEGVLEILPDGYGFLRSATPTTCPVRTTSMSPPRRSSGSACAPGDTVSGQIRPPKGE